MQKSSKLCVGRSSTRRMSSVVVEFHFESPHKSEEKRDIIINFKSVNFTVILRISSMLARPQAATWTGSERAITSFSIKTIIIKSWRCVWVVKINSRLRWPSQQHSQLLHALIETIKSFFSLSSGRSHPTYDVLWLTTVKKFRDPVRWCYQQSKITYQRRSRGRENFLRFLSSEKMKNELRVTSRNAKRFHVTQKLASLFAISDIE